MQTRRQAPVIVAANRGPFTFRDGAWQRGDGGLVSALSHLSDLTPATWVSAQTDPSPPQDLPMPSLGRFPFNYQGVRLDSATYGAYYDLIANHLLWFVQHQLPGSPVFDDRWWWHWAQYCRVNQQFAAHIAQEAAHEPRLVMVHDYHLYVTPWLLRRLAPHLVIEHFTHIPWPSLSAWQRLPSGLVRRVLKGMLASDILGFNASGYVAQFLDTCAFYLDLPIDLDRQRVGSCQVTHYPVSVDVSHLRETANTPAVLQEERHLPPGRGPLIVQIGRTDPSKNLLTGLEALKLVADRHPTCRYLGIFPPSRQSQPVYQAHLDAIRQLATQLQQRFGERIKVVFDNRYALALAALKHYDVLLVNSLADGMNLIAKEGPAVNQHDGVLVLSPETGAFEELGSACLTLDPRDAEATAATVLSAIALPNDTRRQMLQAQQRILEKHTVHHWLSRQLHDLEQIRERRMPRAG